VHRLRIAERSDRLTDNKEEKSKQGKPGSFNERTVEADHLLRYNRSQKPLVYLILTLLGAIYIGKPVSC